MIGTASFGVTILEGVRPVFARGPTWIDNRPSESATLQCNNRESTLTADIDEYHDSPRMDLQ